MPRIKVTSPEGQTAIINAPEDATQDEIQAYAAAKFAEQPPERKLTDSLRQMVVPLTSPGREAAMQDSFFMGFGNEGAAALGAGMDALKGGNLRESYDTRLASKNALVDQYRKEHPVMSMVDAVVPAMASGTGAARLLNPKTIKGAIGYGIGEGAIYGAGAEKPGDRGKGAAVGGTFGGVASGVIPLAVKLATKGIPRAVKGFHDMFSKTKPQGAKEAVTDGDKFLANFYGRLGLTKEEAAKLSKRKFAPSETLADVTSEQSSALLPGLAASSDEAANMARKSSIITRQDPDTLVSRVQSSTGADTAAMANATKYHNRLKEAKKAIGDQIDDHLDETLGVEVGRQDEIDSFFDLDAAKGLKKEVNASLELRKRGPSFTEDGGAVDDFGILDDIGDVNAQIYDEAFMQETSSRLGKRISKLKKEGIDYADEVELKRQFDEIFDDAVGSGPLKDLKKKYGVLSKRQRAFESGVSGMGDDGKPLTMRLLKDKISGMEPKDLNAFRAGALSHYAEKGDGLLKSLGSPTERRRIGLIFGGDKAKTAKAVSEREVGFATVADRLSAGTTSQSKQVAKDTLKGDLDGIDSLFKRLENKRAYSGIGAVGLFINEVVSIIHQSKLSNQAINHIMRTVSTSGDDVNKILKRIAEVDMPKLEQDRLLQEEMGRLAKAVTSGYGAATGSLSERVTGGIDEN